MLGLAVVAFGVLTLRIAPATWRAVRSSRESLYAKSELLARAEVDVRQTDLLEDSAAVIRTRVLALAPRLLGAAREAEALADLSSRLQRVAAESRVRVERTTPVGDSTRSGRLRRVSLGVALEGDSRGTLALLAALARGRALLTPTNLMITATNPVDAVEVLRTEITVQGWYLARETAR
jgi:hypothetical protein